MIEIEGFETPEDYDVDVIAETDLIITISGKQIKNIDNISIYFKEDSK